MEMAELVESSVGFYGLLVDLLGFYLTATSFYLVAAYMVGDKLNRSQMLLISALYVGIASLCAYGITAWALRGLYFASQQKVLDETAPIYPGNFIPVFLALFLVGGILGSLKFMWDVRHPKTK